MRRKGKTLNPLGFRIASAPSGLEYRIDAVNDPVLTHNVGWIGCSTGVVVELTDHGFVDVDLTELFLTSKLVAAHGFDFSVQLVGEKIPVDDVGFDDFLAQHTSVRLDSAVGRSKDGKGTFPPKELVEIDLVDGGLEGIKVVVFLDFQLGFALQPSEVTVINTGSFEGYEGVENLLVAAIFSQ